MKFVVQHNLLNHECLEKIRFALEKNNIPHVFIGIIPFSHEITSDEPIEGTDYLPYGSTSLTVVTQKMGWRGQYFIPETFRAEEWSKHRDDMLNGTSPFTVAEAIKYLRQRPRDELIFTRPTEDLKTYSGQVIECGECADWLTDAMNCASSGSYQLSPDTAVIIAPPQELKAEWRWFVVGGQVIDGSMYRRDGELFKQHETDALVIAEAQRFADVWLPHECCVMDLALVGDEMKVIEFNTINSSGFYDHDVEKVIVALWNYFEKTK